MINLPTGGDWYVTNACWCRRKLEVPSCPGVDVSLKSHHVHFMKQDGSTLADFSVSNDQNGAATLIKRMLEAAEKSQANQLKIGMEATDLYSWHLAHYLQDQMKGYEPKFQASIYVLN
ncbi:IS110 family transposase, partial [Croceicoccus pelagius]|uniref:IS110 family transposase n=1 Tax=Croceicoccus pelagius TaxID=1703341 RepID=UPI00227D3DAB